MILAGLVWASPDAWKRLWINVQGMDKDDWAIVSLLVAVIAFAMTQVWQIRTMARNSLQVRLQNRIEYQKLLFEIDKQVMQNPVLKALYNGNQHLLHEKDNERIKQIIQLEAHASFHANLIEVVYVFFINKHFLTKEENEVYIAWLNWLDVLLKRSDHFCRVLNQGIRERSYNRWFVEYVSSRPSYEVFFANMLFPQLSSKRWHYLDLNAQALIDYPGRSRRREDNPLNHPATCAEWITRTHQRLGTDYSYGGYLEDRSHLWRGHYQEKTKKFIHLGIDYNVPAGTDVSAPHDVVVEESWSDTDQDGGWGGRLIVRDVEAGRYIILGHLDPATLPAVGTRLRAGDRLGIIGPVAVNGGWYPHLHVQCVSELSSSHPIEIDGYSSRPLHALASRFPNPIATI